METKTVTFYQSIAALSTSEDAKTDKNDISEFKEGRNMLSPHSPQKQKWKLDETVEKERKYGKG